MITNVNPNQGITYVHMLVILYLGWAYIYHDHDVQNRMSIQTPVWSTVGTYQEHKSNRFNSEHVYI